MVDSINKKIFGQSMLYGESEELNEIVNKDANCYMPIALAATSGNDPTFKVEQLAERTRSKCEILSMGSSEGKVNADKAVQLASQNGTWVLLQNVHLSSEWLKIIEKRLKLCECIQALGFSSLQTPMRRFLQRCCECLEC